MPIPDYKTARAYLHENLRLLTDQSGHVQPSDQPIWNVSNALLVVLDALEDIQSRRRRSQGSTGGHSEGEAASRAETKKTLDDYGKKVGS
jgi:hypothetical protein